MVAIAEGRGCECLICINKCDLASGEILAGIYRTAGFPTLRLSAETGEGLEELGAAVAALFPSGADEAGSLLTTQRQADAARRALDSVVRAREALDMGVTPDALLTDVEQALSCVGELTGQSVREDITDRIFSKFCVGK